MPVKLIYHFAEEGELIFMMEYWRLRRHHRKYLFFHARSYCASIYINTGSISQRRCQYALAFARMTSPASAGCRRFRPHSSLYGTAPIRLHFHWSHIILLSFDELARPWSRALAGHRALRCRKMSERCIDYTPDSLGNCRE